MSILDAHVHLWDLAVRPQPWTTQFPVLQRSFVLRISETSWASTAWMPRYRSGR